MSTYNIVASLPESTVVAEYQAEYRTDTAYQSEAALEDAFVRQLVSQGYEYAEIKNADDMKANLRRQLERLNEYTFSEDEWRRFFSQNIAAQNEGIVEKTRRIQEDHVQVLKRDDGSSKNIRLLDKENVHNNFLQVLNQYEEAGGNYKNRYDVTILVNGLPLVHIELKRRGVALKEAFNQIERYQRDSFWAGLGLYEYVQLFVISNGTHTKYYSNTTRISAIGERLGRRASQKTSHSFEFTSFWADATNRVIPDLVDFTKTFFARHTLLSVLTRYSVFTSENLLLVMRPYQIAATERILGRIGVATNYKRYGTVDGGGFIWHTTGSGKTLTSFKTAQLASEMAGVEKVLFVVDRKDLDYQTMKEYDRFEKGAANGNKSTKILARQLEDKDAKGNPERYKIIITTIQKLDQFIKKNPTHPVYQRHVVLIFDECHRSQFGDMHRSIVKHFKKYHIFGFTGTPIFAKNAKSGGDPKFRTTAQVFGGEPDADGKKVLPLHTYTIVDAINDGNVLPFRIDYVNTMRRKDDMKDAQVEAINTESALLAPERVANIVSYTLEHFSQKTKRNAGSYTFSRVMNVAEVAQKNAEETKEKKRLKGFNAIFAAASIDAAKAYYREFQRQMAENGGPRLCVALIYSYGVNEEDPDGFVDDENSDDTAELAVPDRDFLEGAIADYNAMFGTAYDTSADKFPNYYKDLSLRMKNREIDLLIVVNMFLTGFDATTLNTLWVDKNLRLHGLIQAFSRTNRILNSIKTFGNIVCFRNLQKEVDDAIALFGDKNAAGVVLLKSFNDYYFGYTDEKGKEQKGYEERIAELLQKYPLGTPIVGENAEKSFITAFGGILRLRNILSSFDEFAGQEILSPLDFQDYTGIYNDLHEKYRPAGKQPEDIDDDLVFEMELVRQIEVNIDYILMLVAKYHDANCKDKTILAEIERAVRSSIELRSKKELIDGFIATVNAKTDVEKDWEKFVRERQQSDFAEIVTEENLKPEETRTFLKNAFRDGEVRALGTDLDGILPPTSRFGGARAKKKQGVLEKLKAFFAKYFGLGVNTFEHERDEKDT